MDCNEVICKDEQFQGYYNAFLYDTSESHVKVLFAQLQNNKFIFGNIIINPINNKILLGSLFDLPDDYNTINCNTKNCDYILFNNEYLLCCSCNHYIICTRFNLDFNIIINFKLNSEGANSYIKIMDNINYLSIFFFKDDDRSLYKKNIYPPTCNNIYKDLYEVVEINAQEFFERKPDTNYNISFVEFNIEKIEIKYNNGNSEIIKGNNVYLDKDKEFIFLFILNGHNILDNNIIISYTITIDEAYSSICTINLTRKDTLTTEISQGENNIRYKYNSNINI